MCLALCRARRIGQAFSAPAATAYEQHCNYSNGQKFRNRPNNGCVFNSKSLQRPSSKSIVPGANRYSPNMNAVLPNQPNSGALLRSFTRRFHDDKPTTPRHVGPGGYAQADRTMYVVAQEVTSKGSRRRPGFGSTSAQRKLPFHAKGDDTRPGPGAHQPLQGGWSPRTPRSTSSSPRTPGSSGRTGTPGSGPFEVGSRPGSSGRMPRAQRKPSTPRSATPRSARPQRQDAWGGYEVPAVEPEQRPVEPKVLHAVQSCVPCAARDVKQVV